MPDPTSLVRQWTRALDRGADEAVAAARALLAADAVARLPTGDRTGGEDSAVGLSTGPLMAVLAGSTWSEPVLDGGDVTVTATAPAGAPVEGSQVRFSFGAGGRADLVVQTVTLHRHRNPVALPDGTVVTPVSFDEADPYQRAAPPDFGLYLDRRWAPPWPHQHLDWPDMGLPADPDQLAADLRPVLAQARAGAVVEIGCLGGHGRTGTALAVLAVLAGLDGDPVAWVRANYCASAIETPAQEAFGRGFPR